VISITMIMQVCGERCVRDACIMCTKSRVTALRRPTVAGPLVSVIVNRFGFRASAIAGSLMSASGFVISAFTPNVAMLYFSYSVLAGMIMIDRNYSYAIA